MGPRGDCGAFLELVSPRRVRGSIKDQRTLSIVYGRFEATEETLPEKQSTSVRAKIAIGSGLRPLAGLI